MRLLALQISLEQSPNHLQQKAQHSLANPEATSSPLAPFCRLYQPRREPLNTRTHTTSEASQRAGKRIRYSNPVLSCGAPTWMTSCSSSYVNTRSRCWNTLLRVSNPIFTARTMAISLASNAATSLLSFGLENQPNPTRRHQSLRSTQHTWKQLPHNPTRSSPPFNNIRNTRKNLADQQVRTLFTSLQKKVQTELQTLLLSTQWFHTAPNTSPFTTSQFS